LNNSNANTRAPDDAAAQLQANGFDAAKQVVDVARFILTGEPSQAEEGLVLRADQATRVPSSDTVQNPAAE
jgi:hypothetical protein